MIPPVTKICFGFIIAQFEEKSRVDCISLLTNCARTGIIRIVALERAGGNAVRAEGSYMKKKKQTCQVFAESAAEAKKNKWTVLALSAGIVVDIAVAIIYGAVLPNRKPALTEEEKRRLQKKKEKAKLRRIKCPYRTYAKHLVRAGKKEY